MTASYSYTQSKTASVTRPGQRIPRGPLKTAFWNCCPAGGGFSRTSVQQSTVWFSSRSTNHVSRTDSSMPVATSRHSHQPELFAEHKTTTCLGSLLSEILQRSPGRMAAILPCRHELNERFFVAPEERSAPADDVVWCVWRVSNITSLRGVRSEPQIFAGPWLFRRRGT